LLSEGRDGGQRCLRCFPISIARAILQVHDTASLALLGKSGREIMFDFRQFLFRSPERDGETDRRRLALLQQAVHSALADAEYESNGLRGRLEKARQSAAFLLEQMDDGVPETARQVELANVEGRLVGAERRLSRLRIQLTILRTIESMLVTAFEPLVPVGAAARPRVGVEAKARTGD
jgi:hypothetical protein